MSRQQILNLNDQVTELLARPDIPRDVKTWANDELDEVQPLMDRILRPDAFEQYLVEYVRRQSESDDRDEPACKCRNSSCSLLRGNIPPVIRMHDDARKGIAAHRRGHGGEPVVLREAESSFREMMREVVTTLRRVITALSSHERIEREGAAPEPAAFY
ncbi:hypothetical protein [Halopenitus persicus]|uniref:hypothetical protein n=1 Tax=Halopenitus persicus TaxID=1048396 RepID=UPI000BBB46D5|nr:hypothetical protein [Halopenitus persicus]